MWEWVGPFYPKGLKKQDYLTYYTKIFHTNEINTTFYNIPSRWVVNSWVKKTPKDFVFSAKIPQTITHDHLLDVDYCLRDLDKYLHAMEPLIHSKKVWAFLIQLPPFFNQEDHFSNLKEFIDNWPDDYTERNYDLVVEFRHNSWMNDETFAYLKNNHLTYCAVIEPKLPPRMDVTNPEFAYIRFHGFGKEIWFDYFFSEEEIHKYANDVKSVIESANNVGIYFNNHFSGYAAKDALMMMEEINLKPRNEPHEIEILEVKKASGTYSKGQTSLDKFIDKKKD
ncbi:MAG: DUF72 domain-containing protein [Candidatus Lokiarchaeota archaeon]